MDHSILAPSAAPQWANCPGSVALRKLFPEKEDGQAAIDGQAIHALGKEIIDGRGDYEIPGGTPAEIIDMANTYALALINTAGEGSHIHTECPVYVPMVHPDCYGTLDAYWYELSVNRIHIADGKMGWGIVEPEENWQLILYALGMLERIPFDSARLYIIQPRPFHPAGIVRYWDVTTEKLKALAAAAAYAAGLALSAGAHCLSGKWCRHCPALYSCSAAAQAGYNALDVALAASAPAVGAEELSRRLGVLTRAADIINQLKDATEEAALALSKSGVEIPGWKIGTTAGSKKWAAGKEAEVRSVASLYGVPVDKPAALVTPTQAVKAGLPAEVVDLYSFHQPGKARMEPVDMKKLSTIFGGTE
jgi:hypothetical protein